MKSWEKELITRTLTTVPHEREKKNAIQGGYSRSLRGSNQFNDEQWQRRAGLSGASSRKKKKQAKERQKKKKKKKTPPTKTPQKNTDEPTLSAQQQL